MLGGPERWEVEGRHFIAGRLVGPRMAKMPRRTKADSYASNS